MALKGVKILELAGLAPAPFCGNILADFGAQVTKIDKHAGSDVDSLSHGKKSIVLNLKSQIGANILQTLSKNSDVLIEPFRPGVMEKLGLGPDTLMKANPRLIYARLTGYGQNGPMAQRAGHDINYVAMSGLLSMLGRSQHPPTPPVNLVADFAGGSLFCALGIILALFERVTSGKGQVVDSSMVDGSAYLGSWIFRSQNLPIWANPRGENMLDTGSHFYNTYLTKDGQYMAVGAIEPQFYAQLLEGLGLTEEEVPQHAASSADAQLLKDKIAGRFATKTRAEWTSLFEHTDACVTPVLSLTEAARHPHNMERGAFTQDKEGVIVPETAPKLSRTPGSSIAANQTCTTAGQHTHEILKGLGYSCKDIAQLEHDGVVGISKGHAKL